MGIFDRLNKLISKLGSVIGADIPVVDLGGAEKQAPLRAPRAPEVHLRPPRPPSAEPLAPRPMPPGWEDAIDIGDIVYSEPRDINEFMDDYESEWTYTWNLMPTGDMSDEQIQTAISQVELALETASWQEIWEDMIEDFWDWYREMYETT